MPRPLTWSTCYPRLPICLSTFSTVYAVTTFPVLNRIVLSSYYNTMTQTETYRLAFKEPPGTNLAGVPTKNLKLTTPYVSYGLPYDTACAKHVAETFHASRVYIIASGTLSRESDKVDRLISAIGKDNVVGLRKGMTPHTPWSDILSITAEAREANADCVVTLGAGSTTDGAKIVVLVRQCETRGTPGVRLTSAGTRQRYQRRKSVGEISHREQGYSRACGRANCASGLYPHKLIRRRGIYNPNFLPPSISSSADDGNVQYYSLAGGTDDATHHKHGFLHSGMGSRLVILDPDLCLTTPEFHWLSTGIRSMDHCIEALCSLEATPESDRTAEQGLRLLVPSLLKCKADPTDVDARGRCQQAVIHAMESVRMGIPMGGSHAIGHQLGPLGVPHGVTSCIMCPAVMKYNYKHGESEPQIRQKQEKIIEILWSQAEVVKTFEAAGLVRGKADLGDLLDAIIRAVGMPRTLTEVGIGQEKIPALAKRSLDDQWSPTNPVPLVKAEQVEEILQMVI